MHRVDAFAVIALMADVEAARDFPVVECPRKAVGAPPYPLEPDAAIAIGFYIPDPFPTITRSDDDAPQERFLGGCTHINNYSARGD